MLDWMKQPDRRLDVAAYLITVTWALWSGWRAADLVWGLWVTGVLGTLVGLVAPWLLLTFFPGLGPGGGKRVETARERVTGLVMLTVVWGTALAGYAMAGSLILGWIPLPADSAADQVRGLPEALVVSMREYWVLVLVNLAHQAWPVWRAIRRGGESPTNPIVSVGRVLVVCTVMVVLHVIHVNAIAVAILLFLFYIPEDVFAERVLGMH